MSSRFLMRSNKCNLNTKLVLNITLKNILSHSSKLTGLGFRREKGISNLKDSLTNLQSMSENIIDSAEGLPPNTAGLKIALGQKQEQLLMTYAALQRFKICLGT